MARKKATPIKRSRAVTTKKDQEILWLGGQRLLGEAVTPQERAERQIIVITARVLNISPFGVNILGSQPYINKLGLAQKAKQYEKNVMFLYKWIHRAKDDTEKAICECKITDGKKDLSDWILGECSPATMKMGTLKGYQNHMAQTRARNRAILETFGVRIHEEMIKNIELLCRKGDAEGKHIAGIGGAVTISAEEMTSNGGYNKAPARPVQPQQDATAARDKKIDEIRKIAKGKTDKEKITYISKMTSFKLTSFDIPLRQATLVLARLLNATS